MATATLDYKEYTLLPVEGPPSNAREHYHTGFWIIDRVIITPVQMAQALTQGMAYHYKNVPQSELEMVQWGADNADTKKKSFYMFMLNQNQSELRFFVMREVLNQRNMNFRAKIIVVWLKVVEKLTEVRNYSSAATIIRGLTSRPVQNLKRTWAMLTPMELRVFKAYTDLYSCKNNFGELPRFQAAAATNTSHMSIPHFAMVTYDLLNMDRHIKEGTSAGGCLPEDLVQRKKEIIEEALRHQDLCPATWERSLRTGIFDWVNAQLMNYINHSITENTREKCLLKRAAELERTAPERKDLLWKDGKKRAHSDWQGHRAEDSSEVSCQLQGPVQKETLQNDNGEKGHGGKKHIWLQLEHGEIYMYYDLGNDCPAMPRQSRGSYSTYPFRSHILDHSTWIRANGERSILFDDLITGRRYNLTFMTSGMAQRWLKHLENALPKPGIVMKKDCECTVGPVIKNQTPKEDLIVKPLGGYSPKGSCNSQSERDARLPASYQMKGGKLGMYHTSWKH